MTNHVVFRQEHNYMPLKLKAVMEEAGITHRLMADKVLQMNGRSLSETALNLLINWGTWPAKTPEASIKQQVETLLRERGTSDQQLAAIWQLDDPMASHTNRGKVKRNTAEALSVR